MPTSSNNELYGRGSLFDTRIMRILQISSGPFSSSNPSDTQDGDEYRVYQTPFAASESNGASTYNTDNAIQEYYRRPDQVGDGETEEERARRLQQLRVWNRSEGEPLIYKGSASMLNPYAITRLYGAYGGKFLIDRYNMRKYYELDGNDKGHYASNPTTSNIIKWGNSDKWGRRPYQYQDFVFSKHFGKIQNNRLITLRRYTYPTYDNLNFSVMEEGKVTMHPVSTAVTYFGEGTGNTLSDILKFSAGIPWEDERAQIWDSTAVAPSMEVMDKATGWDKFFGAPFINAATVAGFLGPHTKFGNENFDKDANKGLPEDPYKNGQYTNRIIGPVNQINTTKRRAKDGVGAKQLQFNMDGLTIQFDYIARPIAGVNNKAVLLDCLSNILTMCYASAVFFGGMHRFDIKPVEYPFNDEEARRALHSGKIIGDKGAPSLWVNNFKEKLKEGTGGGGVGNIFATMAGTLSKMIGSALQGLGVEGLNGIADFFMNNGVTNGANKNAINNARANVEEQIASSVQAKAGQISFLTNMRAVFTGEPVGDWHLVIGNPMAPIVEIGNLVCENVEITFSDELGPDDFPIGFTAKVKLAHGMPKDRDGIEAMFNRGAGRIYSLPDKFASSADGQTKMDKETGVKGEGPYRWTTGYPVPAKTRNGTNGTTDAPASYSDAYKTLDFAEPSIAPELTVKDLFYKENMSKVVHHIMPWQTRIIL